MDIQVKPFHIQESRMKRRKVSNDNNHIISNLVSFFNPPKVNFVTHKEISWEYDPHRYKEFKSGKVNEDIGKLLELDFTDTPSLWILLKDNKYDKTQIESVLKENNSNRDKPVKVIIANRDLLLSQEEQIYDYFMDVDYIYFDFDEYFTRQSETCEAMKDLIEKCGKSKDLVIRTNVCIEDLFDIEYAPKYNIILQSPYRNEGMALIDEFNKSSFVTRGKILLGDALFVMDNTGKRNMFEKFIRAKRNNTYDSMDKIMYNLGGKYLWGDEKAINKINFGLFFPGMDSDIHNNYKFYKKFRKETLSKYSLNNHFNYFGVTFTVNAFPDLRDNMQFILNLQDMIETDDGENTKIISLTYTENILELNSFFYNSDKELIKKYMPKILGDEKRKGALQKRGFLYVRLIANLLRSTGRVVSEIALADVWKPVKGKRPTTRLEWADYNKPREWQGDYMGNGITANADNLLKYGFYANFMTGMSQYGNFQPWISNTATSF